MAYSLIEKVLARLKGVRRNGKGWVALCPAHDDKSPSLAVSEGDGGRVLLHCHAGCSPEAVLHQIGLSMSDLFPFRNNPSKGAKIVATYSYLNESGAPLFQVVRCFPKIFRVRRPDGNGGWAWNLNGVCRVLYRLPELLAADHSFPVFVVEGEKDVEGIVALGPHFIATCNPGGAGKWTEEYSAILKDRSVVILPDNDEPGRKHALQVGASLLKQGAAVKVVILPNLPPKGDISDWISQGDLLPKK